MVVKQITLSASQAAYFFDEAGNQNEFWIKARLGGELEEDEDWQETLTEVGRTLSQEVKLLVLQHVGVMLQRIPDDDSDFDQSVFDESADFNQEQMEEF